MKDCDYDRFEEALRTVWIRRQIPLALNSSTRAAILAQLVERGMPERGRWFDVVATTPVSVRLAWAASIIAGIACVCGVQMLKGLSLVAQYAVCFFLT